MALLAVALTFYSEYFYTLAISNYSATRGSLVALCFCLAVVCCLTRNYKMQTTNKKGLVISLKGVFCIVARTYRHPLNSSNFALAL